MLHLKRCCIYHFTCLSQVLHVYCIMYMSTSSAAYIMNISTSSAAYISCSGCKGGDSFQHDCGSLLCLPGDSTDDSLHVIQTNPFCRGPLAYLVRDCTNWTSCERARYSWSISCNNCIDQHLKAVTTTIDNRHTCSTCTHILCFLLQSEHHFNRLTS